MVLFSNYITKWSNQNSRFASREDRPFMTSCMLTPAGPLKHCRHIYGNTFPCCAAVALTFYVAAFPL